MKAFRNVNFDCLTYYKNMRRPYLSQKYGLVLAVCVLDLLWHSLEGQRNSHKDRKIKRRRIETPLFMFEVFARRCRKKPLQAVSSWRLVLIMWFSCAQLYFYTCCCDVMRQCFHFKKGEFPRWFTEPGSNSRYLLKPYSKLSSPLPLNISPCLIHSFVSTFWWAYIREGLCTGEVLYTDCICVDSSMVQWFGSSYCWCLERSLGS